MGDEHGEGHGGEQATGIVIFLMSYHEDDPPRIEIIYNDESSKVQITAPKERHRQGAELSRGVTGNG